uniref:Ig-like domain-containing protein n=1 Tax=Cyanistes caeruleus TaxID=156563 RepID=A0A8C0VGH3_CYACU
MGWALLLKCACDLVPVCSLVQAAVTQQPSSLSANVGDTVRITCTGSSNSYGWYQQKVPGTGPVTVIYYNDRRPSGIPSRFSGSGGTLTITGVQAEDEAVYFCGGYDSSSGSYVSVMKMTDFQRIHRGNKNGILLFFSSPRRVVDVSLGQTFVSPA